MVGGQGIIAGMFALDESSILGGVVRRLALRTDGVTFAEWE